MDKNKKKIIRLTEGDIHRMVNESVKAILKEGQTGMQLQNILNELQEIANSGYIPFASPSPSSTEMVVKKNVLMAIECLTKAVAADKQLY
jgi:hypothetical protein